MDQQHIKIALIVGGIAVVAYFLFFRGSSSSGGSGSGTPLSYSTDNQSTSASGASQSSSTSVSGGGGSGGGGSAIAGNTTLQKGAVSIDVNAPAPGGATAPAPQPVTTVGQLGSTGPLTVPNLKGMSAQQAANTLNNAGFAIGSGGKPLPAGQLPTLKGKSVGSQSPGANTKVGYGTNYWPTGSSMPFVDVS